MRIKTRDKTWSGERIKHLRARLKLTQIEFAAELGVSFSSVNRWENKNQSPSKLAVARMEELNHQK